MVCGQVLGLLFAAQTLGPTWGQSVPASPCPDVFQYQVDSSGNWRGLINIPAPQPGYIFRTTVELAINAVLPAENVGILKLLENENDVWRRINAGDRRPIQFHLYFPLSWPLPVVRRITSNNNVICIGNTQNNIYTKLSLEHILYPIRGNTFLQQYHNLNQQFSGVNNFKNVEYTPKNDQIYEIKPLIEVASSEPAHKGYPVEIHYHEVTRPQATSWPSQTKTTALSSYATACPSVFRYQQSSSGEWYGIISVPNPYPIVAIDIRVEIYVIGTVPLITRGFLGLLNNLYDEWNRLRTGERYYIQYKLDFPLYKSDSSVTPPLPTVKSVTANNEVICRGNEPNFPVVNTLSYQYSIFSDRCTSSSLDCPYNIEQSVQKSKPVTPTYTPPPRTYTPAPPIYEPTSPIYTSLPPVYKQVLTERPLPPPVYIPEPPKQKIEVSIQTQCGTLEVRSNPLITHGEDTVYGQWPWHAALYLYIRRDIKYRCGGSFIGTRTVITAAHCVTKREKALDPDDFIVYLGRYKLRNLKEEGSQYRDVTQIYVHPSYNGTSTMGDVAVLILSKTVQITAVVRPVCLWDQGETSPTDIVNKEGLVPGWGLNENDEPTETLKMVKMPVVSQQTCIWSDPNYYSQFTSNSTFCAGYRNGSSVCNGDSGGGMVFPKQQSNGSQIWMLRGIVSHSKPRDVYDNICDTKSYIVFTDVAHYLTWIHEILI